MSATKCPILYENNAKDGAPGKTPGETIDACAVHGNPDLGAIRGTHLHAILFARKDPALFRSSCSALM
jgi:hypothetical protein